MRLGRSRRSTLLAILGIIVLAAIIAGGVFPLYSPNTGPGASSSQSSSAPGQGASAGASLSLSGTISLGSNQGRIDHMSVDLARRLLFVAGYGNNTVGIVDLKSRSLVGSIGGLSNPQGVAWVSDAGRLFVSNAGDGTVGIYAGDSFASAGKITLPGDADNLRYAGATRLLYVGYGSGGIAAVNTTSGALVWTAALQAHPESFEIEVNGRAIYVNVPPSNLVVVLDKTTGAPISSRPMTGSNFPMALDEGGGRLLIGTRNPSELRVLDTSTPALKSVANVTIPADPDDVFLDSTHGLVYVSCGAGSLVVIKQVDRDHYSVAQTVPTGQGARTSLWVPELGSLFVAVPAGGGQQARILIFGFSSTAVSSASSTTSSSRSSTSLAPIPTAATLSISPGSGPSGLLVALTGGGYYPGARYQVCVAALGNASCGFEFRSADYLTNIDQFAFMGGFIADPSGNIPAGTKMPIPDLLGMGYNLGVVRDGEQVFFVSAPFKVEAPTISIGAVRVVSGQRVTLTGSGYAPSTTYTVCQVIVGTLDCGYTGDREETPPGIHLGTFTTDANGNIPSGTKVTIAAQPPGQEAIGAFIPSIGFILVTQVQFTIYVPG